MPVETVLGCMYKAKRFGGDAPLRKEGIFWFLQVNHPTQSG